MENSRPLLLSPEILVLSEVKLSGYFFHYGPIPFSLPLCTFCPSSLACFSPSGRELK